MICSCCPRKCNVTRGEGFCAIGDGIFVSKFMIHKWEEPVISGKNGSGAVFFSGCNLRCCYCQNAKISITADGEPLSSERFIEEIKKLLSDGADNINLVSPTPYVPYLAELLPLVKKITDKPIIYNCGGYESPESLKKLEGLIDVYLPDFKYMNSETAKKYSNAADYPEIVKTAIDEMIRQQPEVIIKDGLITNGVIIRHLVLPGHRLESREIIEYIHKNYPTAWLSLMSQYTPDFNRSSFNELNRRITSFEYNSVLSLASEYDMPGFSQLFESANKKFTPDF